MKNLQPTIRDVATLAGVSHQTVSRVINGDEKVSPSTKEKVTIAIKELNYIPSVIARSMARGKTHTIACISPSIIDYTYASIIEAAQTKLRINGYFMISVSAPDKEMFTKFVDELVLSRRTDGLMVINPCPDEWHEIIPPDFPHVVIGSCPLSKKVSTIALDEVSAGRDATRHLLDLGHKRIALVTGPLDEYSSLERLDGYKKAINAAGLSVDPDLIFTGDWSATAGYQAVSSFLSRKTRFSAVFAQNDRMAIGVVKAIQDADLIVPDDISVIGFDDMPLSSYFSPSLTTMQQNMNDLGAQAARLLIRAIEKPRSSNQHIRIPSQIIIRGSTSTVKEGRK